MDGFLCYKERGDMENRGGLCARGSCRLIVIRQVAHSLGVHTACRVVLTHGQNHSNQSIERARRELNFLQIFLSMSDGQKIGYKYKNTNNQINTIVTHKI